MRNQLVTNPQSPAIGLGKQYVDRYIHEDDGTFYVKMSPNAGTYMMNHKEFDIPDDGIVFKSKKKIDAILVAKVIFCFRFTKYKRKTENGSVIYRSEYFTISHKTWQKVRDWLAPKSRKIIK